MRGAWSTLKGHRVTRRAIENKKAQYSRAFYRCNFRVKQLRNGVVRNSRVRRRVTELVRNHRVPFLERVFPEVP